MSKIPIVVVVLICVLFATNAVAQDNLELKKQFLTNAPPAWAEFVRRAKRLQGSFLQKGVLSFSEKSALPVGEILFHGKSQIKQTQGCWLFLEQSLLQKKGKDTSGSLRVINPQYVFELRRAEETKDWVVAQLKPAAAKRHPLDNVPQEIEMWIHAPITFFVVSAFTPAEHKGSLPTMLSESGFLLKGIATQTHNGKSWPRIEFEYQPGGKSQRVPSAISGWAVLDAERSWCLQEYEIQLNWANGRKVGYAAKYEYENLQDSFPVLKKVGINYHGKTSKSVYRYDFDFRESDASPEDFTLSAFGFPNPVGTSPPPRSRWHIWVAIAALTALGLSVGLRILKRRIPNAEPVKK